MALYTPTPPPNSNALGSPFLDLVLLFSLWTSTQNLSIDSTVIRRHGPAAQFV